MKKLSIEICKKLEKAGYDNRGEYTYLGGALLHMPTCDILDIEIDGDEWVICPTVEELIESLPGHLFKNKGICDFFFLKSNGEYIVGYRGMEKFYGPTLIEPLANLWIWCRNMEHIKCKHESDGICLTSFPAQYRCVKCGEIYQ